MMISESSRIRPIPYDQMGTFYYFRDIGPSFILTKEEMHKVQHVVACVVFELENGENPDILYSQLTTENLLNTPLYMVVRKKDPEGLIQFPGGKMELGESIFQTGMREFGEELNAGAIYVDRLGIQEVNSIALRLPSQQKSQIHSVIMATNRSLRPNLIERNSSAPIIKEAGLENWPEIKVKSDEAITYILKPLKAWLEDIKNDTSKSRFLPSTYDTFRLLEKYIHHGGIMSYFPFKVAQARGITKYKPLSGEYKL